MPVSWTDFSHTQFRFNRPLSDYAKVQKLYSKIVINRRWQLWSLDRSKKFLNVGCGGNREPGFLNLDYQWQPGVDLCWDIRKGIPLPGGSLRGIYSEHTLEHVSQADCLAVLQEFRRMLVPGGAVRLVVPDLELYVRHYVASRAENPDSIEGARELNDVCFSHGHCVIYDAPSLILLLKTAGFVEAEQRAFREGRHPDLILDSEYRKQFSLYVEAMKK
jgi:Methyltransferase domain